MTLEADNVRVALTGAAYVAPLATTAPTTPTSSWAAGWEDLGWLNEDGIAEEYADDVAEIKAWQLGATVRKVIKASEATFKFTCIETNKRVLELFHKGSTITGAGPYTMDVAAPTADRRSFGFDVIDGDVHLRIVVPDGEVSNRVKSPYKADEPSSYEITLTCYPDGDGVVMTKLSDDPAWAA